MSAVEHVLVVCCVCLAAVGAWELFGATVATGARCAAAAIERADAGRGCAGRGAGRSVSALTSETGEPSPAAAARASLVGAPEGRAASDRSVATSATASVVAALSPGELDAPTAREDDSDDGGGGLLGHLRSAAGAAGHALGLGAHVVQRISWMAPVPSLLVRPDQWRDQLAFREGLVRGAADWVAGMGRGVAALGGALVARQARAWSALASGDLRAFAVTQTALDLVDDLPKLWDVAKAMVLGLARDVETFALGSPGESGHAAGSLSMDVLSTFVPGGGVLRASKGARVAVTSERMLPAVRGPSALVAISSPTGGWTRRLTAILHERARLHDVLRQRDDVFAWVGHDVDLLERAVRLPPTDGPARLVVAPPELPPTWGNMARLPVRERLATGGWDQFEVAEWEVANQLAFTGYDFERPLEVLASGAGRAPGRAAVDRYFPEARAEVETFLERNRDAPEVKEIDAEVRGLMRDADSAYAAGDLDAMFEAMQRAEHRILPTGLFGGTVTKADVSVVARKTHDLQSAVQDRGVSAGQRLANATRVPVYAPRGTVELVDEHGVTAVFVDGERLTAQSRERLMTTFHPRAVDAAEEAARRELLRTRPLKPIDEGWEGVYEGFPEAERQALEIAQSAERQTLRDALHVEPDDLTPAQLKKEFARWSRAHHPDLLRARNPAMTDAEFVVAGHRWKDVFDAWRAVATGADRSRGARQIRITVHTNHAASQPAPRRSSGW